GGRMDSDVGGGGKDGAGAVALVVAGGGAVGGPVLFEVRRGDGSRSARGLYPDRGFLPACPVIQKIDQSEGARHRQIRFVVSVEIADGQLFRVRCGAEISEVDRRAEPAAARTEKNGDIGGTSDDGQVSFIVAVEIRDGQGHGAVSGVDLHRLIKPTFSRSE